MGREIDTWPVTSTGELIDSKVAAYVAKYATKAAECTGTLDRRISPADQLAALPIRDHARRHIAECIRLSKPPDLEDLRLAAWAHMLGFGGHSSTKSRAYSTTLGALRVDRWSRHPVNDNQEETMTTVHFDVSMSLDGFITGPGEGIGNHWARTPGGCTSGCSAPRPALTPGSSTSCTPGPERS